MKTNNPKISKLKELYYQLGLNKLFEVEKEIPFVVNEYKLQALLDRIKAIRTNSDYVPNYNKPKVHSDIIILYETNFEMRPISDKTKLTQKRPPEFENNMEVWAESIKKEVKDLDKNRRLREETVIKEKEEAMKNAETFLSRFMVVN